ncbi:hypothetical protein [Cellulomonas wangsupingiae]|uniref:Uncharacterized protein n=1 Tax=Cellulomonas wangsupingiae TaxID=2968085 RepID=A0ABY5K442_9CELL|nr:hypothetical protein [Cellulomonas wangsupingiae]MCC2333497.1 hypothetical protein [Cellulomonas wangsupingiae]MCM0638347.1 hypothetical protein [Cellulomonas wangsupingiae]UUI63681.1 hypothetical protein NP075_11030 [Cellulomonas wangsupingiae]
MTSSFVPAVVAGALLALGLLALLVRTVRDDGLGHRPPPPSHPRDTVDRPW